MKVQGPYPAHREADVALRDGSTVHVRPVRPDDEERLLGFLRTLSRQSRFLLFFSAANDAFLAEEARRGVDVDYVRSLGLVATTDPGERIIGHAHYCTDDGDRAEVMCAIADEFQGRGLGTILLGHLAEAAAANGVRVFRAEVLPENHRMLEVLRESGFPFEVSPEIGNLVVTFPTSLTTEAIGRFEQRERNAAVNALKVFFAPRSVAVIGASRDRAKIGGEILRNLLEDGFVGSVYPVNPAADLIQGLRAYPSVEAIADSVDLAVVAVPAAHVVRVAEECGRKRVRALVVISAGFAEAGSQGRALQEQLVGICRAAGMRVIGPNCIGIVNTDPAVRLNAAFAIRMPPRGRIGFLTQSGALGLAMMDYANSLGLGLSTFVSVGNKADISSNDLLSYWETDPNTDLILLYLESFGNPRKFSRIARRVSRSKPIVVVKSGRSRAGARATTSHTGALIAASDVTVDALFRQAGIVRTDTLEELFAVASLLAHQPVPPGRRVGIITNAGGPGILCADACEAEGLEIPILEEATQARLRGFLPSEASVVNPVDMIASATAEDYRKTIQAVAEDPSVDALVVIFIPRIAATPEGVATATIEAARSLPRKVPVLGVFMSAEGAPAALNAGEVRIPVYAFPEAAAIALARAVRYGEWRSRPVSEPARPEGLRRDEAAAVVATALRRGEGWLMPEETRQLLACYGLPFVAQQVAPDPAGAGSAAEEVSGRVALKALVPGVVHKTELGAVRLGLEGRDAVRGAAEEMQVLLGARGYSPTAFLVQAMAPEGAEMLIGVIQDSQFGPVVACGAGGVMVELLRDISVRLAPLTRVDATEMIQSLKTYPLLTGFRGRPTCDVGALEDALARVSVLAEDLPQVAELDLNPIIVHPGGTALVDARVRLAPSAPPRPIGARG